MPAIRPAAIFLLKLLLYYALLMAPWPGWTRAYGAMFRAGANILLGSFGTYGTVEFQPLDPDDELRDTLILMSNSKVQIVQPDGRIVIPRLKATCGSRLRGYYPTAFLVALILASPIGWSRRWKSLLGGLLLVHAFVALRLALPILQAFSGDNEVALYEFGPFWDRVLDESVLNLVKAPASHFIVPLLIWITVTIRRADLGLLMHPAQREGRKTGAGKVGKRSR